MGDAHDFEYRSGIGRDCHIGDGILAEVDTGPSLDRLVAQDDNEASLAPLSVPTRNDANQLTEAKLRERLDVEFHEAPLTDVLEMFSTKIGLQFYVKQKYLEEVGLSSDAPVTLTLKQVSAEMALELVLEQLELTYITRDGVILVTTEEDLENVSEIRVYNCRDLLATNAPVEDALKEEADSKTTTIPENEAGAGDAPPGGASIKLVSRNVLAQFGGGGMGGMGGGGMGAQRLSPLSRTDQLIEIITTTVSPDTWDDVGGAGSVAEFDGLIVIRQNPRVHRQVEQVLEMLREATKQQGWNGFQPTSSVQRTPNDAGVSGGFF